MKSLRPLAILLLATLSVALARAQESSTLPDAPKPILHTRTAPPGPQVVLVKGFPYTKPTPKMLRDDYFFDTYWYPGIGRSMIRALYAEARGKPSGWDTNFTGFSERFGSAEGVTIINGTVRYGMETLFHEDLRYLPCIGCRAWRKIENAFLSEITARHDDTGRRFFTLSPTIADFSGPIIAHTLWYPGNSEGPLAGVISARTVFVTRIGIHILREVVFERHRKLEPITPPKTQPLTEHQPAKPAPVPAAK